MEKKAIFPADGSKPIGPYSPIIQFGDLIFVSGQIGFDASQNKIPEGITAQTKAAMTNIQALLTAAGCTFQEILQTTVYLAEIADFTAFNEVYQAFFQEPYPSRATVAVKALPRGALIEISAIAGKSRL